MKIVIAGGGRIGRVLAARLVGERHTVTVIDGNREVCERIFDEVGAVTLFGDATDARMLERAGLRAADVAAGLLPRDADNLAFAILARSLSSARVMVRMLDDRYQDAYRIAGVREIIPEADVVVTKIETAIEFPQVVGSMPIGRGDAILFEIAISPRALVAGRTVLEVRQSHGFPGECLFIGLVDADGRIELPTGASRLESGLIAILAARRTQVPAIVSCLTDVGDAGAAPSAELLTTLRRLDFFAPLGQDELGDLLRGIELQPREVGSTVYRRGDPSDALYIVMSGAVELVDDTGHVLATVGPGGLFGETALLTGEPRSTGARTAAPTELVGIGRETFARVALANPAVTLEMSRQLGRRLAETMGARPSRSWAEIFGRRAPRSE